MMYFGGPLGPLVGDHSCSNQGDAWRETGRAMRVEGHSQPPGCLDAKTHSRGYQWPSSRWIECVSHSSGSGNRQQEYVKRITPALHFRGRKHNVYWRLADIIQLDQIYKSCTWLWVSLYQSRYKERVPLPSHKTYWLLYTVYLLALPLYTCCKVAWKCSLTWQRKASTPKA